MHWLSRPRALALTGLLVLQIAALYGVSRREQVPPRPPLAAMPAAFGNWTMIQESGVEAGIRESLRADDVSARLYLSPDKQRSASLFVAYFRTQRTGVAPHSPRHCLPGAGWVPEVSQRVSIAIPGRAEPLVVNHYVVSKGDARSVVLYWYQSRGRVVAGEFEARIFLVLDAIRYNRTDAALIRVILPVSGEDTDAPTRAAVEFVRALFIPLSPFVGG